MIRYALACEAGHSFDSWFRLSDDFETQNKRGFVTCPVCNSAKVQKQIMAPQVRRSEVIELTKELPQQQVALMDPAAEALRAKIRELRAAMIENSEDVGNRFAEEARNIHYGDAESRSIRGQASLDDARELHDEGIAFLPIPDLPDERN